MKKNLLGLLTAAIAGSMALSASAQVATDVTAQYLKNYEFNSGYNYDAASTETNINDNKAVVADWTCNYPQYHAYGVVEYGFKGKIKGQEAYVPAAGYQDSKGGCLVMATAWRASITASQEVTLPAGHYIMQVPVYCAGKTTSFSASRTGWVPNEGSAVYSATKNFASKTWQLEQIQFTIAKETAGKIQLGYDAYDIGSSDNPQLCYDYVKLLYAPLEGTPANLVYNANFSDNGAYWVNAAKDGETTFTDGVVTLTSNGKDNVISQPITLDKFKSYTFMASLKTNTYEGDKGAFAGFWNWKDSQQDYTGGAYSDYAATTEWKTISSKVSGATTKAVVLAVVGAGKEASYKDVIVFENPTLSILANDAEVDGNVTVGTEITVESSASGFDIFYQIDDNEPIAYTGAFTAANVGETVKVFAAYNKVEVASKSFKVVKADLVNLMAGAVSDGQEINKTPKAPWVAFNTDKKEEGNGAGWDIRNANGTLNGTGDPASILFRWDGNPSPWVYGYKITLQPNHTYELTFDTRANEKPNTLYVSVGTSMEDYANEADRILTKDLPKSGALETVSCKFNTNEATDYYIIFNSSYNHDTGIIHGKNFILEDLGETTGIEAIETEGGEAVYYNLNGLRVNADALVDGIYVKVTNGKAEKVMVRK